MEYSCAHCGRSLPEVDGVIDKCKDHPNGAVDWHLVIEQAVEPLKVEANGVQ